MYGAQCAQMPHLVLLFEFWLGQSSFQFLYRMFVPRQRQSSNMARHPSRNLLFIPNFSSAADFYNILWQGARVRRPNAETNR